MPNAPGRRLSGLSALPDQAAERIKQIARQGPAATESAQVGEHPGVERWPVKTGTDADVAEVGVNHLNGQDLGVGLVDTTLEEMLTFKRAADMPPVNSSFLTGSFYQNHRSAPTETTVWRMKVLVVEARLEQDGDYHLVLQGTSKNTMIGEVPNPDPAYVKNPIWLTDIRVARTAVDQKLGGPLKPVGFAAEEMGPPTVERTAADTEAEEVAAMTPINAWATVVGVGFFDSDHQQTGVAPTAIELHPIFSVVFD